MGYDTQQVTILLVDDEENILRSLQRLLMDEEYFVETATSGEMALAKLQTLQNVGLIVSDQRMPGMNGAEFLGRSREIVPDAQRILLTGYSDISATIEAINTGGAGRYLSKPWDDEQLLLAIRGAVELYLQNSEKRRLNDIISRQKQELEEWNEGLKKRLLQSAATIREQNQVIKSIDEKSPISFVHRAFDGFFEVMGERNSVHARTVSTLVTDVARKMSLDSDAIENFRLAALLHDAGKFGSLAAGISKHIEEMSDSEVIDYRQHPLRGEQMFNKCQELEAIAPLIRSHHEAFDGSGFPDRLKGEDIPLGARLIAIANFIENSARSVEHNRADYAMMNIRYNAGSLFDPQLINRFQSIVKVIYYEGRKAGEFAEVIVSHMSLVPGMTLARDVESGSGVLLMQRGNVLDAAAVAMIRSHYRKNPPKQGIYVQIVE